MSDSSSAAQQDRLNRAAFVIRRLKERVATLEQAEQAQSEPVAIVGIGCRFPGGADTLEAFWELLDAGRDAIQPLEPRWALLNTHPEEVPRWAGLLTEAVDEFDAAFFGISPREARSLDPQHRLLLEVTWEALENAGIAPLSLNRTRTGVFIGACFSDYSHTVTQQACAELDAHSTTGNLLSVAAGRVAYTLGLQGPCLTIDTACSSSLVSVHLACRSLRARESELALAGGVNLLLSADTMRALARTQTLSPEGRCRTFDAAANGFVRGEGCGLLVLKRLSDAQRDGDRIVALLRGSAINHDGRSTGLTAPNVLAQEALLREALSNARAEAASIGYIETHGTGTTLGDPIEVEALRAVIGPLRTDHTTCVLGAVKTNIGHLEGAAGVAGLIKAALALWHQRIPKNLNFRTLNAHIELTGSALTLATEPAPWPRGDRPRLAGVSSFGLSGTNAHVVLEEAPVQKSQPAPPRRKAELLVLSARSEAALRAQAARLGEHLQAHPELPLYEVAFSLVHARSAMEHRLALTATHPEALQQQFASAAQGQLPPGASRGTATPGGGKLAFLFTGQGAQVPGMGQGLYASWPAFREAFEQSSALFDRELVRPLREVMWAAPGSADAALLDQTAFTQPALFVLEYALCALWLSWGVVPDFVAGHSIGELVAACVAGVFSLADAVRLCAARGRLMQALPAGGEMVSIAAPEAEVAQAVARQANRVSIAAVNGPAQVVIAGEEERVAEVAAEFAERGVRTKPLAVSHAFHSPLMDPMLQEFRRVAETVRYQRPAIALVSNLSGTLASERVGTAEYWVLHVREAVRFADGVRALHQEGVDTFVEVGPQATLLGLVAECMAQTTPALIGSLRRGRDEAESVLEALGGIWTLGRPIEWTGVYPAGGSRVPLPTYPWQRQRHWVDAAAHTAGRAPPRFHTGGHPLLGEARTLSTQTAIHLWETTLDLQRLPWLGDHRVRGEVIFPGAGYLEMALAASLPAASQTRAVLEDVSFEQLLVLPANEEALSVQLVLTDSGTGRASFQIASSEAGGSTWTTHARGSLVTAAADSTSGPTLPPPPRLAETRGPSVSAVLHYQRLREHQLNYGPAFQGLIELWPDPEQALARVHLVEQTRDSRYLLPPALLDACLQATYGLLAEEGGRETYVPVRIARLRFYARPPQAVWAVVRRQPAAERASSQLICDLDLADDQGQIYVALEGLCVQRLGRVARAEDPLDGRMLAVGWHSVEPLPEPPAEPPGQWLLVADEGSGESLSRALSLSLAARGQKSIRVVLGPAYVRHSPDLFCIDASRQEDYRRLLDEALRLDGQCRGVVQLVGTNSIPIAQATPQQLAAEVLQGVVSATYLTQAVLRYGFRDTPRLFVLTRGAQAVVASQAVAVCQSPLLGLGRTVAIEHPELRCKLVDLDPAAGEQDAELLVRELLEQSLEDQIALRGEARYVARLLPSPGAQAAVGEVPATALESAHGRPFRLEIHTPGRLDQLALYQVEPPQPGPGEVLIEVEAAGLNFRDVLLTLGAVPDDGPGGNGSNPRLGNEAAGTVVAVGAAAGAFKPGERVLALGARAQGSFLLARHELVVAMPAELSFAEAATLPLVFLTAYYALEHIARLRPGERVLIHAGAGGVGLAAIQWAQHRQAEIFATAGSEQKRSYLRSLGIEQVFDSRSLGFVKEIRERTAGAGVDVVLNSLGGEFIAGSLSLLRDFGRFVEIGVKDYYADRPLGTRPFLRNLSFSLVDLRALLTAAPQRAGEMLRELVALFASGTLRPLPVQSFPASQAAEAFRYMAQAKHIGKLALVMKDPQAQLIPLIRQGGLQIRSDRLYLITGGFGGLGLVLGRWLVEQGARHLLLIGRHAPQADVQGELATLRSAGAQVTILLVDIATADGFARLSAALAASAQPLGGIAHAAGLLSDRTLLSLSEDDFRQVLSPKVLGAYYLHQLGRNPELDFFLLYSSATALLGSPGQANYAAANAFLDALAHQRRQQGLPALSIAWGPFSGVGMAARAENRAVRLQHRGLASMEPAEGLRAIARLLPGRQAAWGVLRFDLQQWIEFYPGAAALPYFSLLPRGGSQAAADNSGGAQIILALRSATADSRPALLQTYLREQVGRVLRLDFAHLDVRASLLGLGMDSLLSLELRNLLEADLGLRLSGTTILTYGNIVALCRHLLEKLGMASSVAKGAAVTPSTPSNAALQNIEAELTQLSEEEILARLMSKLEISGPSKLEGNKV